ncbi:hypothetical protein HMPREF3039_02265 [Akkermansia sp. KLE1798]|nr:hypothetical protein HMPREF3039_02265 [Akkermansia sp. KLE1798]
MQWRFCQFRIIQPRDVLPGKKGCQAYSAGESPSLPLGALPASGIADNNNTGIQKIINNHNQKEQ